MIKTKEIILFDTQDYEDYDDGHMIADELHEVLNQFTRKIRGQVYKYILLAKRESRYGSICNDGASGYLELNGSLLANNLLSATQYCDRIVVKEDQGELQVNYFDHDGVHKCAVKSIPESKGEDFEFIFKHKDFEDKMAFIEKLSSIKIKKSELNKIK